MAKAGIKPSITAAIVANLITAFLCLEVGEVCRRSGFGLAAWQGQQNTSLGQPRSRGKSLQFGLRALIERFSSQV
jgi:hypothetical protein